MDKQLTPEQKLVAEEVFKLILVARDRLQTAYVMAAHGPEKLEAEWLQTLFDAQDQMTLLKEQMETWAEQVNEPQ